MGKQAFDYYYGDESNQFSFYRIPRQLITGEQFKKLSTDAKLLYGLLPELYEGWDPQQRRQALDNIQDMSKQFGRSIDKSLEADKQRGRAPVRPVRRPVR